jgi:large subunit ribosomal protein L22
MDAISTQKYIRTSPRKLRLVADLSKKMTPKEAIERLPLVHKRAAAVLEKVIKTAVANAVSQGAKAEDLIFKEIQINEGPRLKRGRPVSRGQWHPILKRMSHVRVIVATQNIKEPSSKTKIEEKKVEKERSKSRGTKS